MSYNDVEEMAYNSAHSKTRVIIKRCFSVWKSRFRCLDKSGGTLLYSAEKTCRLVMATAVLHNICIKEKLPLTINETLMSRNTAIQPNTQNVQDAASTTMSADNLRRMIIQQF